MYVLIVDGKTHEIIPDENPAFPGIPITQRYSQAILAQCVHVDTAPPLGWLYNSETEEFTEPPAPPEPEPVPPEDPQPTQDEINAMLLLEIASLKQRVGVD